MPLVLLLGITGCTSDLSNQIFYDDAEFLAALPSRSLFYVTYVDDSPVADPPADDILLLDTTLSAIASADGWLELTAGITDDLRELLPAARGLNYREWGPYLYEYVGGSPIYLTVEVTRSDNEASYTYTYYHYNHDYYKPTTAATTITTTTTTNYHYYYSYDD